VPIYGFPTVESARHTGICPTIIQIVKSQSTGVHRLRILAAATCLAVAVNLPAREPPPRVQYEPTLESLDRHATPVWLMDAKFGIFVYGPQPTRDQWREWCERQGRPSPPPGRRHCS